MKLPPEFDPVIYAALNPDLAMLLPDESRAHYLSYGFTEGRVCSKVEDRDAFLSLVPHAASLLEIGPYTRPSFRRPLHNVRYLDAFSTAELCAKATVTDAGAANVPDIDYVWSGQPYDELIPEPMDAVFSAHNIEHQPDLIRHLQQVGAILAPSGRFYLAVPDRRYCFDHFLPDTNFADVLSAYYDRRIRHVAGSLFEHRLLTTHNFADQHWAGQHGMSLLARPVTAETGEAIRRTMGEIEQSPGYFDTHAWQFTPPSFRHLIDALGVAGLIPFKVERIYPTVKNSNEFFAVLGRI